jgi:hypothetical protein
MSLVEPPRALLTEAEQRIVLPCSAPLPAPIRRVLGQVRRRLGAAAFLRGVGIVAFVAVAGAIVGMGADLATPLSQIMRWVLWGLWLSAVTITLVLALLRPLLRHVSALDLAAVAERAHPQLGERLTGAVALLCASRERPAHGAPALIAALAGDAATHTKAVDPARAVSWQRPARRAALGLLALALAALPVVLWPRTYGAVARRFLTPWSDLERIGRFTIAVAPGDRTVAIGSDLTVGARVWPRFGNHAAPESTWLEWSQAKGNSAWYRVAMPMEGPDRPSTAARSFAVTVPRLARSLIYRVACGSARSRTYQITAIEPPDITTLTATVEPPAYTQLAAVTLTDPGRIDAWESSQITLNMAASRSATAITIAWPATPEHARTKQTTPGRREAAASLAADGRSGTAVVAAEASGPLAITIHDVHGLSSLSEPEGKRQLFVRFDAAPVVALAATGAARESTPVDVLSVPVAADDDVAVDSVELHYAIERGEGSSEARAAPETGHIAVPLPGVGTRAARGEARLELAGLDLKPGDTLTYRVRVADNRPSPRGPNVTWSPGRVLEIMAQAEPILAQRHQAERQRLQAELDAVRQAVAVNRRETEQLRYAADAAQRGNGRWEQPEQQRLEQREADAHNVVDRLQLLARSLADTADSGLRALARPAQQIAEVEAESSRAMLDQARRAKLATERLDDLRQADHRLTTVGQQLDQLRRQFNALAQRDADFQQLRDLARREEGLATSAGARASLEQLQRGQTTVQHDLDALLKKSPSLRGELLAEQAHEADALARKAHALAQQQGDLARRSGEVSSPVQAAALAKLADAQRTLEENARRVALDADPPLVESGRTHLNTDLLHNAIIPLERGDLDEARQRLEAAELELRRFVGDLHDIVTDPRASAQRLARRQELLGRQVNEALQPLQGKTDLSATERAERAAPLLPLAERQDSIARLAAGIPPPSESVAKKSQFDKALQTARQHTLQAASALRSDAATPRQVTTHQARALAALKRLADILPDPSTRRATLRRLLDDARQSSNEVARDLDRVFPETGLLAGDDRSRQLEPLAKKQATAAANLAAFEPEALWMSQQRRAHERLKALSEALEALRATDLSGTRRQEVRDALPRLQANARAALDRLDEKLSGRAPADDLTAELAEDQRALAARLAQPSTEERAELIEDQLRIAAALRNLQAPDALAAQAQAVRRAEHVAEVLRTAPPDHDLRAPIAGAVEAAESLAARLTQGVGAVPADPPGPVMAEAEQTARRQRQLRERLQSLLSAQVAQQHDLREQATTLGRELADLCDRAQPLSQRARGPAQQAAEAIGEQAPRAMDQGAGRLAQGQVSSAREPQRQAAALIERGAQQAEDLAAALRADGQPTEHPASANAKGDNPQAPPRPLADARAAMRRAAQHLTQAQPDIGNLDAAQQAMQEAAHSLRAATERGADAVTSSQATTPATPRQPSDNDPQAALASAGTPDLAELKATVVHQTGRTWGELPGHLRTEILQMAQGRYREDYARIIQLYFREIATGAGRSQP